MGEGRCYCTKKDLLDILEKKKEKMVTALECLQEMIEEQEKRIASVRHDIFKNGDGEVCGIYDYKL